MRGRRTAQQPVRAWAVLLPAHVSPSAACQTTTGVGRRWARWSHSRDTCGTPPRSSSATAGAFWSSGTGWRSVQTASSWATRYVGEASTSRPGRLLPPLLMLTTCARQQLESLCWERSGSTLVSSHSDGSYAVWSADAGDSPMTQPTVATTPYGECQGGRGRPLTPEYGVDR